MIDYSRLYGIKRTIKVLRDVVVEILQTTPVEFSEKHRYLPPSVTSQAGKMSFDSFPYWREILNCFDVNSNIREVNLRKGVQVGYTTVLESILFYFMFHVRTAPCMMVTADKDLMKQRLEENIIPMIAQGGFMGNMRSNDESSSHKKGITAGLLSWLGGGFMIPLGANNPAKFRQNSILLLLKDEIDAWSEFVGTKGEEPDSLTDHRCKGYTDVRKIFRGSTPVLALTSKITRNFLKGDQRYYYVSCLGCGFPQHLEFTKRDELRNKIGGIFFEFEDRQLIHESVCYRCPECKHDHFEHDKDKLFDADFGAIWKPTAQAVDPFIRSYDLNGLYSPVGFASWASCVTCFLDGYDPIEKKVIDMGLYQTFVNNIKGKAFEEMGSNIPFESVSAHRRMEYKLGEIPNVYAMEHCGAKVGVLTCTVDVHKSFLAVKVTGWVKGLRNFVIDYWHISGEDFQQADEPGWGVLEDLIDNKKYYDEDGREYFINVTFIDSGYSAARVLEFCQKWKSNVYPIIGRDAPEKNQSIKEFTEFETMQKTVGYKITVDLYKNRLGPALKREWNGEHGLQPMYHFNAPYDIKDKYLKELTREFRAKKLDLRGRTVYYWKRDNNEARNEMWDCLVYAHCAIEMIAWKTCIDFLEMEKLDWTAFWDSLEKDAIYFEEKALV